MILLAACSSKASAPTTAEQTKAYADKICACKDEACARPLYKEFLHWMSSDERTDTSAKSPPDLERLVTCAKATGAM